MSNFSEKVLDALERNHGIDEDAIADNLASAIRGETVKKHYTVLTDDQTGRQNMVLTKVTTVQKPRDVLAGSMIYDTLTGGKLGITGKVVKQVSGTTELYEKYRPALPDGATLEDVVARPGEVIEGTFVEKED